MLFNVAIIETFASSKKTIIGSCWIDCLGDACERYDVAIHASVLMTNHIHLLMTPCTEPGISRVMNGWETDRFNTSIKIIEKQAPYQTSINLAGFMI